MNELEQTIERSLSGFDIYFFDVDSTLINVEGIEVLARFRGADVFDRVRDLTEMAMASPETQRPSFLDIYCHRLNTIKPYLEEVDRAASHIAETCITDEAREVVPELIRRGKQVYLVSGGIDQIVGAVAKELGVTAWFGVKLIFNPHGEYVGFHWAPTTNDDGKATVASWIRQVQQGKATMFVGDGMTDARTKGYVDCFAAYMGITGARPAVFERADTVIYSLTELLVPGTKVFYKPVRGANRKM